MPNTTTTKRGKTPAQRADDVFNATANLIPAVARAIDLATDLGADHPDVLSAWEAVEALGATVHRQSRLLAGKTRGG